MIKKIRHITFLLFLLTSVKAYSQVEVNVITKKTEHSFSFEKTDIIKLHLIKAKIKITGWNHNEVKIIAYAKAKNKDKKEARKEIEYIKYYIAKNGEYIFVRNVFSIPDKVEKVNSVLQMEYELFVPKNSRIHLVNKYGENYLTGLNGSIAVLLKYGKLNLNNLNAHVKIRSDFVNIDGGNLYGKLSLTSGNTDVELFNLNSSSEFVIRTGKFSATAGDALESLKINAKYCEVKLINPNINNYNYSLHAKYSSLELPVEKFNPQYIQTNSKENFEYLIAENKPMIRISTTFNQIKILGQ